MAHKRRKTRRNRHRLSRSPSVEESNEVYDGYKLPIWKLLITLALGLVMLFPCVTITQMIFMQVTSNDIVWQLRGSPLATFFTLGCGTCLLLLCISQVREILLPIYVFGHEATHSVFVYVFYGDVSEFSAKADGGYIIANRANILVSLSPYIFPFWTLLLALAYGVIGIFCNLSPITPYFFLLLGASWIFNLFWTVWMIPLGQSDLSSNGTFFSLTLIYLANAVTLSILLEFTKISSSFTEWLFTLLNLHSDLFHTLLTFFSQYS